MATHKNKDMEQIRGRVALNADNFDSRSPLKNTYAMKKKMDNHDIHYKKNHNIFEEQVYTSPSAKKIPNHPRKIETNPYVDQYINSVDE
tara:strand:- start:205 stop:471 length:267 start_codon:yes stop_codon:yes gene_type:complete